MSTRMLRRTERGATTAEYVGIVALVALLAIAVIAFATPLGGQASGVVRAALCKIGGEGCTEGGALTASNAPDECTISSHEDVKGGSITIIATGGADSGYELMRVRSRQPDGTITTEYVVRTKGKITGSYEFTLGGKAGVDTGEGSTAAGGGASLEVGAGGSWGSQTTFPTEEAAKQFIEEYQDNWGAFGERPDGAPAPDSEYYELSGQASVSGEAGPLSGSVGQSAVLGLETFPNGEKKVKVAMTTDAALDLGIPLPDQVLQANAEGKIEATVVADLTFDADGNVVAIGGSVQMTANGQVELGANSDALPAGGTPIGKNTTFEGLELPNLGLLEGGRQYELSFSTDFRLPDGSVDHSAVDALSDGLARWVTTGEGLDDTEREAVRRQLEERSQLTFNSYDYSTDEQKIGGEIKVLWVKLGGEVHQVITDKSLLDGYYLDPSTRQWTENVVCGQ